jgi:hypothetical protein
VGEAEGFDAYAIRAAVLFGRLGTHGTIETGTLNYPSSATGKVAALNQTAR